MVAVIGATIALVVSLSWWYRRGDQRVRSRLAATHTFSFGEPGQEPETTPTPEEHNGDALSR